jgi:hypothetical protein
MKKSMVTVWPSSAKQVQQYIYQWIHHINYLGSAPLDAHYGQPILMLLYIGFHKTKLVGAVVLMKRTEYHLIFILSKNVTHKIQHC